MADLKRLLEACAQADLEPETRPFRIDVPEARESFLLLHGFTGNPKEVRGMGEALAASGYASFAPRYPGHGTLRADFLATRAEDWIRRAIDAYLELRSEYGNVHVLGHSMGGLIASALAATFEVPKLILLAPAFRLSRKAARFAPCIAPFVPVMRKDRPVPDTETDPVRRRLHADYWADDLVSGAAHLERIRRTACALLPKVRSRVLVVTGTGDETVQPSVGEYLRRAMTGAASFESRMLEGAGHSFPFDGDSERALSIVRDWIGKE